MEWLRIHPYAATSAVIGLFVIAGALFIESRRSINPGELTVWGGTGAPLLNPTSYAPGSQAPRDQGIATQGTSSFDTAPAYIPPAPNTNSETSADDMDFESFLLSLIAPQQQSAAATTSTDTQLAYSFIPQGLIAVHTPQNTRTPEQQRLFDYGNDAGSYIQTYEDSNRNAGVALRDQAEDRQNIRRSRR